jgi:site-specific recombinase XerC
MKDKNYTGKAGNLLAQLDKIYRHNRQGSFKTKERYYEAMKRFCRFVSERFNLQKLANISEKHIFAYVEDMKNRELSPGTIKTELSAIRFWHDKISDARYELPTNEVLNIEKRTFGGVDRAWEQVEFNRMLSVCCECDRVDYAAIFTLARCAGLRIHECFRIDTATAEKALKTGEITIKGKGGKLRCVPINRSIEIELATMLRLTERGHKLFVLDGIKTHSAIQELQQFIIAHRKEVQSPDSVRPLTFHGLRHFCAAQW